MAHPSPGKIRTSRDRALEIGTNPQGFDDAVQYDVPGGHPVTPDTPRRTHEEQGPSVQPNGPGPIQKNPIKLGG